MRKLVVTSKTGFDVKDINTPIIIRDNRGILFYSTESLTPKVIKFNLPAGTYFVDQGSFTQSAFPKEQIKIILPKRQRWLRPNPKGFAVRFAPNPNKCSVNWGRRTITFDTAFKEKPLPQVEFIMYHEFGHRFYETEKYCDIYAVKQMLNDGYNPSQIGYAQIDSLSDAQGERKEFIIDSFQKR